MKSNKDLATRIANNPSAYLARFNRISTARKVADENKRLDGRSVMHRIFNGPIDPDTGAGEFWMTTSKTIASALCASGFEMVEFR